MGIVSGSSQLLLPYTLSNSCELLHEQQKDRRVFKASQTTRTEAVLLSASASTEPHTSRVPGENAAEGCSAARVLPVAAGLLGPHPPRSLLHQALAPAQPLQALLVVLERWSSSPPAPEQQLLLRPALPPRAPGSRPARPLLALAAGRIYGGQRCWSCWNWSCSCGCRPALPCCFSRAWTSGP